MNHVPPLSGLASRLAKGVRLARSESLSRFLLAAKAKSKRATEKNALSVVYGNNGDDVGYSHQNTRRNGGGYLNKEVSRGWTVVMCDNSLLTVVITYPV